jgi:glycosyltransferase involved in cell wall biosynthesis
MVLLSHPIGNPNVRAAAMGLLNAGKLADFYTTIALFPGDWLDKFGNIGPLSEIRRRQFDARLQNYTSTYPWFEAGRLIASKIGLKKLTTKETGIFSIDAVFQNSDKWVAKRLENNYKKQITGVYAYEDGALYTFNKAKSMGLDCFYDLPIGYWRTARLLLDNEREQWPDWATTLTGFSDSDEKLARKDQELKLASKILVASSFTAKTLENYHGQLAPVQVIPYGFPPTSGIREYSQISKTRPLKLLFVGGLSQRKGIANLFAAVEKLKNYVELTVIGHKPKNDCPALNEALCKHRWIESLPHAEILNKMREHDVLLFPSLFEGFGLVITEAMSQGTPVITTDRTAGPDLIDHGRNGWLIGAGSTQALQESIEEILYRPTLMEQVGREAMKTAVSRPWSIYGQQLSEALSNYKQ